MALFNIPWLTESIKKCTIKYLIERYLGHFLCEELDLSQLDIELFNGTASIESIPLNVHTINTEVSPFFPLKFLEGFVEKIEFTVPWSALWTDSCSIQLDGIRLNFCKLQNFNEQQQQQQQQQMDRNQTSILSKSMMASSMEMAEEILQQESEKYEGLEKFAQLINSIIRRVKLSAKNTVIKFQFPQNSSPTNVDEIEFRIGHINCEEEEITLDNNNGSGKDNGQIIGNKELDSGKNSPNGGNLILSDVVTKCITMEGIELFINNILITKLYGKHTFKIRFNNDNHIDMDAYFGSYIFAILNSNHLRILQQFFQIIDNNNNSGSGSTTTEQQSKSLINQPKERLMTAQDYRRIQELWHNENILPMNKQRIKTPEMMMMMDRSMISFTNNNGGHTWSTTHRDQDSGGGGGDGKKDKKHSTTNPVDPNNTLVTCNIKIPGIMLCLISANVNDENNGNGDDDNIPQFNEMPMIDNLQTFIGINSFLNDMLQDYNHIRLLASNLCVEIRGDNHLQFSCINISSYEYHNGILNNLFWVHDNNNHQHNEYAIQPSIKLKKNKNIIDIMLAPTSIRLDPTIIERHPKLLELFIPLPTSLDINQKPPSMPSKLKSTTAASAADDALILNIECEQIELELFFPIPDLRTERNDYSTLHDEVLLITMKNLSTRIEPDTGELLCNEIQIDIRIDNTNADDYDNDQDDGEENQYKLFYSKSEERNIKLHYSTLIPIVQMMDQSFTNNVDDHNGQSNNNNLINQLNSMQESINFLQSSAINHDNQRNEPFQIKRNLFSDDENFNSDDNGHERIITPGDRDHCQHYLAYNRDRTRFYTYIHVPYGEIYFDNKKIFELIYNRFANDLILWRPFFRKRKLSSSLPSATNYQHPPPTLLLPMLNEEEDDEYGGQQRQKQQQQQRKHSNSSAIFYSCKNIHDDDSLCDSTISDNSYHSIMETSSDMKNQLSSSSMSCSNEFVIEFELDTLIATFQTKSSSSNSSGSTKGKNNIFLQNFLLGIVGNDGGGGCGGGHLENVNPKTVICLCSENLSYKYNDRPLLINNSFIDLNSELNLAVEIQRETDLLKKIKLTVQLKNSLLLGLELPVFEDLWEFINVHDDDILGYICPRVIIELHVDLMKSGIVFDTIKDRTTLIHFQDIYLTSMVVENTEQTILRFFIEEALLCFKRNQQYNDYLKNFIPIIDTGIIDINLKISKNGHIEWKGSNNEINLKVCYDSLAALCQFLQSFSGATNNSGSGTVVDNSSSFVDKQNQNDQLNEKQSSSSTKSTTKNGNLLNSNELLADALSECTVNDDDDNDDYSKQSSSSKRKEKNCYCQANLDDNMTNNNKMDESNFLILGENDLGSGINTSKGPRIRILVDEPIPVIENHFTITHFSGIPEMTATTIARYLLDRMSLRIYLYAGKDFDDPSIDQDDCSSGGGGDNKNKRMNDRNTDAISQVNLSLKNENMKTSQRVRFKQNSVLWENIDLISTTSRMTTMSNPVDTHFSFKSTGGSKRKTDTYVVLVLKRIRILFDQFDKQESMSWLFRFMVQELEIIDKVSVSKINKMLYEYYSESMPRRQYSNMFSIRMTCYRNFQDKFEEADLTVSLKPLRVNVDQDTLLFLMDFFSKFNDTLTAKLNAAATNADYNDNIDEDDDDDDDDDETKNPPTSFTIDPSPSSSSSETNKNHMMNPQGDLHSNSLFIKSFTFLPDVPIRLDYHGKHIDLKQGALPGIALGLAQLNQSELYLKKLTNKHGLLGIDKVIQYAIEEWGRDIKRNQLPSILGGVGPMHSFIQLFQGIRDLFWIPIDQYRRDQRIVRGIQRGAYAFSVSTAMATLELANRLVVLIQNTAQFAHNVVTPPTPGSGHHNRHQLIPASQPRDLREGFTVAYAVIREGFHDTFRGMTNTNLVADDTVTVIGEVVRQIPSTVVRPIIHLSQATSSVLVGFRNQLTPEARKDDQEKWKNVNDW
nr:autophagy-related protein 2 homolog B-like [Dermatophagoides farinae]